ncbi:3-oxoacyl-[acyl-carrier protein] reductase [Pseudooceanicola antarcticus]|uniref:3-oxoacyl-ACP reductase n=1 Tax=Pseudooceanicola antarcticus TaxID=1247613 RepID=A0A285HMQ4_9RHOB|nr:SDR family oxidoreductase [Pseudooceanicola antarcticus]PJE27915.1 3-oxoacyl-ACP reductase [Pseudooceanicola antarcticus]SNY35971.1 3-oxoacyl-[acyl-carrier protein] reductase [Pseudooceanicola antarcticus]
MRLKDKVAIVTGAAQGFGAGIARRFAEEGAKVMVADLKGDLAAEVAAEIGGASCAVNVADEDSVKAMLAATEEALGPVDILVNNAGVTHLPTPLDEVSEEDFDRVYAVNMKAIYLASKIIVPGMKARGSGAICNISSTAGISPRPNLTWYNASKGWVNTATRSMAVELAPQGIRVNAVNPVAGETPLLTSFMGEDTPEIRSKFLSTIPMGRFTTPKDIADATLFLCSEEAGMVTGMCMTVDGGRCI